MHAYQEAQWLEERSEEAEHVFIIVSASFGGQGVNVIVCFCMTSQTKGVVYSVGGGSGS